MDSKYDFLAFDQFKASREHSSFKLSKEIVDEVLEGGSIPETLRGIS